MARWVPPVSIFPSLSLAPALLTLFSKTFLSSVQFSRFVSMIYNNERKAMEAQEDTFSRVCGHNKKKRKQKRKQPKYVHSKNCCSRRFSFTSFTINFFSFYMVCTYLNRTTTFKKLIDNSSKI